MCTPYPEKRLIRVRTNYCIYNNIQESNSNDDPKRAHG